MKVTENQSQKQTQTPKTFILSFNYRRTGMGGFSDIIIISFRTRRPVKNILNTSRSGNHGQRSYRLFPGRYLAWDVDRSNGGNLYVTVKILKLGEDGNVETETEWQIYNRGPVMTLSDLPVNIRDLLIENKDVLPLWSHVFPFDNDKQDNEKGEE